jgi:hypothetical protein
MHKIEFGQNYCMHLLKMILNKLTLYFFEFNSFSLNFRTLKEFLEFLN